MKNRICEFFKKKLNNKGETITEVIVSVCVFVLLISIVSQNFFTANAIVKNTVKDSIEVGNEFVKVANNENLVYTNYNGTSTSTNRTYGTSVSFQTSTNSATFSVYKVKMNGGKHFVKYRMD